MAAVVLAAAGASAMFGRAGSSAHGAGEPVTSECLRSVGEISPVSAGELEQRLVARDGAGAVRVYVSEPGNWIAVCRSGEQGAELTFGTLMAGTTGRLRLFGDDDSVLKANLLLGRLPAGATRVEARLPSGQTLTGTHDGDIFVVWAPGSAVGGAQVTAFNPDGSVIATVAGA